MTRYTKEQITLMVAAREQPRTLDNSIWQDAFERNAPAIVAQQEERIAALEAALSNALEWTDILYHQLNAVCDGELPLGVASNYALNQSRIEDALGGDA